MSTEEAIEGCDLICGIELLAGGYELAWSFNDYLQQIQRDIYQVIQA